jgi:hypothetical protein
MWMLCCGDAVLMLTERTILHLTGQIMNINEAEDVSVG